MKFNIFLFAFICSICLSGCTNTDNSTVSQSSNLKETVSESTVVQVVETTAIVATETEKPAGPEMDLSKIEIKYELQNAYENEKQKFVVFVKNNSSLIFSGSLAVLVKAGSDDTIGQDTIYVEKLKSGQQTFAIIWVKPNPDASIKYQWLNTSVEEDKTAISEKINQDLTKQLKKYVAENFGDAINKNMKTSWYDLIKDISVYENDSGKWAVVKVDGDKVSSDKTGNPLSIMNAVIFGDIDLSKVELQDLSGKVIDQKCR